MLKIFTIKFNFILKLKIILLFLILFNPFLIQSQNKDTVCIKRYRYFNLQEALNYPNKVRFLDLSGNELDSFPLEI